MLFLLIGNQDGLHHLKNLNRNFLKIILKLSFSETTEAVKSKPGWNVVWWSFLQNICVFCVHWEIQFGYHHNIEPNRNLRAFFKNLQT